MKKETPNHKPNFLLRKWAKTHLQQCEFSNFPEEGPDPPAYRGGEGTRGFSPLREILSTPLWISYVFYGVKYARNDLYIIFIDDVCARMNDMKYKVSSYLFPFVLEYSLVAMATLLMMYVSIGENVEGRSNMLRGIQNLFRIRALETSATDELYGESCKQATQLTLRIPSRCYDVAYRGLPPYLPTSLPPNICFLVRE